MTGEDRFPHPRWGAKQVCLVRWTEESGQDWKDSLALTRVNGSLGWRGNDQVMWDIMCVGVLVVWETFMVTLAMVDRGLKMICRSVIFVTIIKPWIPLSNRISKLKISWSAGYQRVYSMSLHLLLLMVGQPLAWRSLSLPAAILKSWSKANPLDFIRYEGIKIQLLDWWFVPIPYHIFILSWF